MTNTYLARIAVAVSGATALALLPWSANAQALGRTDPSNDVVSVNYDEGVQALDATWDNGDITRFHARHGSHRVTGLLTFQDLRKDVDAVWHSFALRTGRALFRVDVGASRAIGMGRSPSSGTNAR